jgi:hypothetical protein
MLLFREKMNYSIFIIQYHSESNIKIKIININNKRPLSENVMPQGAFKRNFTVYMEKRVKG